jgi:hypothetical protein
MSRMESDPSLYSAGVSRFPISFHPRRSHFPAYSAMIQFGCAFYARRWSVASVWVVTVRGLANSGERGMKKRLESWIGRGRGGGRGVRGDGVRQESEREESCEGKGCEVIPR